MRNLAVSVECPSCRKRVEVNVKRTFINSVKSCPHCDTIFEITGNGARIADKSKADLYRNV
jgi:hypothetical protein